MKKLLSDSDSERFCKMWRDGVSLEEMSEAFGIKPETIRKYAREKFRLPLRSRICRHSILSDPQKVRFLKLNYADLGDDVIGLLIGESADWVHRTAKRLGLEHSRQWIKDACHARSAKAAKTRKEGIGYACPPRDEITGRFIKQSNR